MLFGASGLDERIPHSDPELRETFLRTFSHSNDGSPDGCLGFR